MCSIFGKGIDGNLEERCASNCSFVEEDFAWVLAFGIKGVSVGVGFGVLYFFATFYKFSLVLKLQN